MKKIFKLAIIVSCTVVTGAYSQVGMSGNNPNQNAVLDLNRTDGTSAKGLLLPKVALTAINSFAPMTAHIAGMHVWNTATAGTGVNAVTPGEYFNNGSKWLRVSSAVDAWIQDGNNNGAIKGIGTNDAFDLPFETNNAERMRLTSGGQLLVNTTAPLTGGTTAKVQINNGTTNGALQIKDGTEALGNVLTSDANGVATWQSPKTIFINGIVPAAPYAGPSVLYAVDKFTAYTGCYITLPPGKWKLEFASWLEVGGTANADAWWASIYFSTSSTTYAAVPLANNLKLNSIIIPSVYSDNAKDRYGTGAVFVDLTGKTGNTIIYLWAFCAVKSSTVSPLTTSNVTITSMNGLVGSYGPYTYLIASSIE